MLKYTFAALLGALLMVAGCGHDQSEADMDKPASEIRSDAQNMDKAQLEDVIAQYEESKADLEEQIQEVQAKLKDLAPTETMGDAAKDLKAELEPLQKELSKLLENLKIYQAELAKK